MTTPAKTAPADPETGEVTETTLPRTGMGLAPDLTTSLAELIEANMGGQLRLVDLPRVTIPTGGSVRWVVPGVDGETETDTLEGVIVGWERARAYWAAKLGDGEIFPDCYSADGIHGTNREVNPHTDVTGLPACAACPQAEWGSMAGVKGGDTRAQACREFRVVLLLQRDQLLPTVIRLAPTSIRSFHSYTAALAQAGRSVRAVITRVTLERRTEGGISYSVASFARASDLSGHDVGVARRYARAITGKIDASALLAATDQLETGEEPF